MSIINKIRKDLNELRDDEYRLFQSNLIPQSDKNIFIGVRTPELRSMAKKLYKDKDIDLFLNDLPHKYFDENQLHAFIISLIKDYDECIKKVNLFLPYVDNWATCDQLNPKVFAKNKDKLIKQIDIWLDSNETYTIRFAIKELMNHYLDDDFNEKYLKKVSKIKSEEYYVKMIVAWYFATALAKQYETAIKYIENRKLAKWIHNKTIQKALESFRITDKQKDYLRSLKIK